MCLEAQGKNAPQDYSQKKNNKKGETHCRILLHSHANSAHIFPSFFRNTSSARRRKDETKCHSYANIILKYIHKFTRLAFGVCVCVSPTNSDFVTLSN